MSSLSIRAVLSNVPVLAREPAPAVALVKSAKAVIAEAPMAKAVVAQQAPSGLEAKSPTSAAALLADVDAMLSLAGPVAGEVAHFADVDLTLRAVKDLLPKPFRFDPAALAGLIHAGATQAGGEDPCGAQTAGQGLQDLVLRAASFGEKITCEDVNALVQYVLRESYLETTKDLYDYAEKVQFFNLQKKVIRAETTRVRECLAELAGKADDAAVKPPFATTTAAQMEMDARKGLPTAPALTAEQQAAAAKREADQARLQELRDKQAALPASTESKTLPAIPEHSHDFGYEHGEGHHNNAALTFEEWVNNNFKPWYDRLSEAEQEGVRKALEAGTFKIEGELNSDTRSDTYLPSNLPGIMQPGQDPVAFLLSKKGMVGDSMNQDYTDVAYIKFSAPEMTVEVSVPGELDAADKAELAALEKEYGGDSDDSEGWKAGEPCETKAEVTAYQDYLESQLQQVGDDAQLANVDLQNVLQKQQQVMQMMSNLSKTLHDTALNTIRKIGG